jgi:hypothetical protein
MDQELNNLSISQYGELMFVVRNRFETIKRLWSNPKADFYIGEVVAFHARKIIEAVAFGCLVATKNGLKHVPREAVGQYNAEDILKKLKRKGIDTFPSPSIIRKPTEQEKLENNCKLIIEGIPGRRLSSDELIKIYQRSHEWLHELNPYVKDRHHVFFEKRQEQLRNDIEKLENFLSIHFISIRGSGFLCVLKDGFDHQTKVIPLAKEFM